MKHFCYFLRFNVNSFQKYILKNKRIKFILNIIYRS